MHQFFESLRDEIETLSGTESYLASFPFFYIYQYLKYEDHGEVKYTSKESLENLKHKVSAILSARIPFNLKEELLSWQGAILRHITKNLYLWWIDYKKQYFMQPSFFTDGTSCLALEASCEKINVSPTQVYTSVLEIENLLIKLCTSPNKSIHELAYFRHFKMQLSHLKQNEFTEKRKQAERKRTQLGQCISLFQKVSGEFHTLAAQLAGEDHLLWKTPASIIDASTELLEKFFDFNEQTNNLEGEFATWFSSLFPLKLANGDPNFFYESPLQNDIRKKLTIASNLLFDYTIQQQYDVFDQRNKIMIEHICNNMDKIIKEILVQNSLEQGLTKQDQQKNTDM